MTRIQAMNQSPRYNVIALTLSMTTRPVFRPQTLMDLSLAECFLTGAGIAFFIHNRFTFSVLTFPRVGSYSDCSIYVAPDDFDDAEALLAQLLADTVVFDMTPLHKLRVVAEAVISGRFAPTYGTRSVRYDADELTEEGNGEFERHESTPDLNHAQQKTPEMPGVF